MTATGSVISFDFEFGFDFDIGIWGFRDEWVDNRPPSGAWKATSGGLAICLSACGDDQFAADTSVSIHIIFPIIFLFSTSFFFFFNPTNPT